MILKAPTLKKREKSDYLLEVVTTPSTKSVAKSQIKGGFSTAKKLLIALLVVVFGVFGTGTAALATTSEAKPANAFIDLFYGTCNTLNSPSAYLGGSSPTISKGWNNAITDSPVGNGLNVTITSSAKVNPYVTGTGEPKAGQKWTALEQYGYFSPSYENFKGTLYEDKYSGTKIWPFVGTGGNGGGYGEIVAISDADRSMMMFPGSFDCLTNNINANVGIGNFIFFVTKFSVALASESYGLAANTNLTSETSPLFGLGTGVSDMITGGDNPERGLRQLLFLDWIIVIILIGTMGLIYTGLIKRRGIQAGQSALWMIGASVMGVIFLFNPLLVPTIVDDVVGEVSSSITAAIIPPENANTNLCEVDGTGADASIRQVKCSIWYATIYTPWVKGQFGVDSYELARYANPDKSSLSGDALAAVNATNWMYSDAYTSPKAGSTTNVTAWESGKNPEGDGFPEVSELSIANISGSRGVLDSANIRFGDAAYTGEVNWAIYMLDRQNNWDKAGTGLDYSEVAFNQLVVNKNTHWKDASDAIGSSFLSLLSSSGPVVVLTATSFAMIGYQLSMLLLMALSPFLLLLGVAPGWGRRLAMRWLELIVAILFNRILLILFLALFVRMYMIIVQSNMEWWVQGLLTLILSIVVISQRQKITGIFSNVINFGGDKSMDGGETMVKSGVNRASEVGKKGARTVNAAIGRKTATKQMQRVFAGAQPGKKTPGAKGVPVGGNSNKGTPTSGPAGGAPATGGPAAGSPTVGPNSGGPTTPPTGGNPSGGATSSGGKRVPLPNNVPPKPPLPVKEKLDNHDAANEAKDKAAEAKDKAGKSNLSPAEQIAAREKANKLRGDAIEHTADKNPNDTSATPARPLSPHSSENNQQNPAANGNANANKGTTRPVSPPSTPNNGSQSQTPTSSPNASNPGNGAAPASSSARPSTPPSTPPAAPPRGNNTPNSGNSTPPPNFPPRPPRP